VRQIITNAKLVVAAVVPVLRTQITLREAPEIGLFVRRERRGLDLLNYAIEVLLLTINARLFVVSITFAVRAL